MINRSLIRLDWAGIENGGDYLITLQLNIRLFSICFSPISTKHINVKHKNVRRFSFPFYLIYLSKRKRNLSELIKKSTIFGLFAVHSCIFAAEMGELYFCLSSCIRFLLLFPYHISTIFTVNYIYSFFFVSFKITTFARTEQFIGNKLTEVHLIRINNNYSFIYFFF